MPEPFVTFAPFRPDQSTFNKKASRSMTNVIPNMDGFGPMPKLTTVSDALPSQPLGACAVKLSNNTLAIYAGTRTDLYKLDTSTSPYSWGNVSKSAAAYNVPTNDYWQFTVFEPYLAAHSLGDTMQYLNISAGGNFADNTGAPIAKFSWVSGDFFMVGYLDGEPTGVQWSGVNDMTHWTKGRRGSDKQILPDGGAVGRGFGSQQGAIVFQRDQVRALNFTQGSPFSFTRSTINPKRGSIAPRSVVQIGATDFVYYCSDGFHRGLEGTPIGFNKVDKWFESFINSTYIFDIQGVADPFNNIAWWRFLGTDGNYYFLGYHWGLNEFCFSDQQVPFIFSSFTPGLSWDGLSALYTTIDEIDVPFDSRIFKGGAPTFAGFTTDHKLAYFTGQNLQADLYTNKLELIPNRRAKVTDTRIYTDSPTVEARLGRSDTLSEAATFPVTYKNLSARKKKINFNNTVRTAQFHVRIPEGTSWSTISGLKPRVEDAGE